MNRKLLISLLIGALLIFSGGLMAQVTVAGTEYSTIQDAIDAETHTDTEDPSVTIDVDDGYTEDGDVVVDTAVTINASGSYTIDGSLIIKNRQNGESDNFNGNLDISGGENVTINNDVHLDTAITGETVNVSLAQGSEYYVDSPTAKIQDAIDIAAATDTVYVTANADNNYDENLSISKEIAIIGLDDKPTLAPTAGEDAVTISGTGDGKTNYVVIENMKMKNYDGDKKNIITATNVADNDTLLVKNSELVITNKDGNDTPFWAIKSDVPTQVTGSTIDGTDNADDGNDYTYGIKVRNNVNEVVISDNTFKNLRVATHLTDVDASIVKNNVYTDIVASAIFYVDGTNGITDLTVKNNDISDAGNGVDLDGTSTSIGGTIIISDNSFSNADGLSNYGAIEARGTIGSDVKAEGNWYGKSSGPQFTDAVGYNSAGTGDYIDEQNSGNYIDYIPWKTAADQDSADAKGGIPAQMTLTSTKSEISVSAGSDDYPELTATLTDEDGNPIDENNPEYSADFTWEVSSGDGSLTGADAFTDGGETNTFDPPTNAGENIVKATPNTGPSIASEKRTIDVTPGSLAQVRWDIGNTDEDTAGNNIEYDVFLADKYENIIEASSVDEIEVNNISDDNASVGELSVMDNGYINVPYTVGETAGNDDTLEVLSTQDNYNDSLIVSKVSAPPAEMVMHIPNTDDVEETSDSLLIAGKDESETVVDTLKDEFGNKSKGYDIKITSSADVTINGEKDDTLNNDTGTISFDIASDSAAGTQTITAKALNGSGEASLDVEVLPNEPAKVNMNVHDTVIAGETYTLEPVIMDKVGNVLSPSDTLVDYKPTFAFQDSAGSAEGNVGDGTFDGDSAEAIVDGESYVKTYQTYKEGSDSARVVVSVYDASDTEAAKDTSILESMVSGALASFEISIDTNKVRTTDKINIEVTPKDVNGAIKYSYESKLGLRLLYSDADSVAYTYHDVENGDTTVTNTTIQKGMPTITEKALTQDGKFEIGFQDYLVEEGVKVKVTSGENTDVTDTTAALETIPGPVDSLVLSAADTVQATQEFDFTVTPYDEYWNVNDYDEVTGVQIGAEYPDMIEIDGQAERALTGPKTYTTKTLNVDTTQKMILEVTDADTASDGSSIGLGSVEFVIEHYTSLEDGAEVDEFALKNNYPNPFNPTTNIEMHIKKQSNVKLTIFNMLGQKVKEISRSNMKAGIHKVKINANDLSSGTYIYRMTANGKVINTRKMTLLK